MIGSGNGLAATYYNNMDFTGTTVTRVDPRVSFNWDNGSPDAAIAPDSFSARWTGQVQAQYSQTYTFYARADDGVRLWVNGQLLVDQWKDQGPTEYSGSMALVAGQKYDLKMEYYENSLGAVAELSWSSASTPKQIIPQSQLYSSMAASHLMTVNRPMTASGLWLDAGFGDMGTSLFLSTYYADIRGGPKRL